MLLMLLWIQAVVQVPVVSETLAPPQNIRVDKWLLTWSPAAEQRDVNYTIQYHSFDTGVWKDVPFCKQTSFYSCNVTLIRDESEDGCIMLRVRAERHGLTSKSVKACSRYGDSCSPEVSLTARPGSLTVNLSRNNSMALENGDHVKHKVYYGKEGESLQKIQYGTSSVTIRKLEEGQRYCAKVQYVKFDKPVGPESCIQCEVIPVSRQQPKQTGVIVVVVVVVFLSLLITGIAYILLFRHQRIKQWLQPPCEIPEHFLFETLPGHHTCSYASSISDEHCDIISFSE